MLFLAPNLSNQFAGCDVIFWFQTSQHPILSYQILIKKICIFEKLHSANTRNKLISLFYRVCLLFQIKDILNIRQILRMKRNIYDQSFPKTM